MIKAKKLKLARETLIQLSLTKLEEVRGGAVTIVNGKCEPSGIVQCPGG